MSPVSKYSRRWLRFSLTTMFVLLSLFATVLVLAMWVNSAHQQRDAAAEIEKLGGSVSWTDWDEKSGCEVDEFQPRFLRDVLEDNYVVDRVGEDFFYPIVRVHIFGNDSPTVDAMMTQVVKLPTVRSVRIEYSRISDSASRQLAALRKLQHVHIERCTLGPRFVQDIGRFHNLRELELSGVRLTDEGIAHLAGLQQLESLSLNGDNLTDRGLRHIECLTNLRQLSIYANDLTDDCVTSLLHLTNLEELNVFATKITTAGLIRLAALHSLRSLVIDSLMPGYDPAALKRALPTCNIKAS